MSVFQKIKSLFNPKDMTVDKPWKNLLAFTIPMLIGNIVQQLYNTVDAIVVGRYVGDNALAAVGSTTSLFFLLLVLFIGISSGIGIMVSQYFGAKKREELSYTIGTCITTVALVSVLLMVFAPLCTRPLLKLLNTPDTIIEWSVSYINILLWGVLGASYYNVLTGILRGLGDSFSPLVYLLIACFLNIILDLLFVAVFGWGVAGAAIATVISQFISGVLCLRQLLRMRATFDIGLKYLRPVKLYIAQVTRLGLPTGASQAIFSLAMVLVQSLTNSFGEAFIACNVIVMRIDGFVMMPNFSFSNAMTVFAGQNVGAGKLERVKQGTRECLIMACATAALIVGGILLFGRPIAGMFTNTQEIIDMSIKMLRILGVGYVAFAFGSVLWSVIRGAGDTMTPMWASLISVIAIRVPSAYLLVYLMKKPDALFYALLLTWVTSGLFAVAAYRAGKWRTKGIIKPDNAETA